jgi:hypothetical protein
MRAIVLVSTCAAVATPALAQQQQQIRPPIAQYWVSTETLGGMAAMGAGGGGGAMDMMRRMMSGGGGAVRNLTLQLGSSQGPSGEPRADHAIPPGMNMGDALPLLTPRAAPVAREPAERELPPGMERPKGRLKIYWGCGEDVRAGQPVVFDAAKLAAGQAPPAAFMSRRVNAPSAPAPGRVRTYGDWPNEEKRIAVPENASLRGDHVVRGNYSPEIRFAIGERHDFMPPVAIAPVRTLASGAVNFQWQAIPSATGYFALAIGSVSQDEVIFWSSSEVAEMGGSLFDYLPNEEAARLVRERVLLAPRTTECTVPAQVVREMQTPMLRFVAYGEELNLVHPPRPQDVRQPWNQEWLVKVRQRSTSFAPLAEGMMGAGDTRRPGAAPSATSSAAPPAAQTGDAAPASGSGVPNPVQEGVRVLRGIFGR